MKFVSSKSGAVRKCYYNWITITKEIIHEQAQWNALKMWAPSNCKLNLTNLKNIYMYVALCTYMLLVYIQGKKCNNRSLQQKLAFSGIKNHNNIIC